MKALKITVICVLVFALVLCTIFGIYFFGVYNNAKSIEIMFENNLDRFVFLEFYDKNNSPIPLAQMDFCESMNIPSHTFDAFIAKEDKRFYSHNGVDIIGIMRAGVANIKSKKTTQGGSTITQQLAKNLVLSSEKKLSRKISEVALARKIEENYTKEEILTMYLNVIYFGENTFGITNASKLYFGKSPEELDVCESATLAGIIASPENYSPIKNPQLAREKRDIVLKLMKDQGYISESEYQLYIHRELELNITKSTNENYDYFNHAQKEASAVLGISERELATKNYKIFTYIDSEKQSLLSREGSCISSTDGVLVAIDNETCGVLGIFESRNNMINQKRSPASLIKPLFVYAPALEENVIFENSIIKDEITDFNGYQPHNYLDIYYGNVTAKTALAKSLNVPCVKILDSLSIPTASRYATKLGMPLTDTDSGLAIALGGFSFGYSPLEISAGYTCLARGGEYQKPCFIREIQDESGNIIYSRKTQTSRVFGDDTCYITTDMLKECTKNGTAKGLCEISPYIASKTGTNGDENGNIDAYTCCFTTAETFFCWLGHADFSYMDSSVKGSSNPVEHAKAYFSQSGKIVDFAKPESVVYLEYDGDEYSKNGKLLVATEDTPKKYLSSTHISKRYYPKEKSLKYSYPQIKNPHISQFGEFLEIEFLSQEFARYEIRNDITGEMEIEILGNGDVISVVLPAKGEFASFEITAYNATSQKKGETHVFEKLYLKKNFLPSEENQNEQNKKNKTDEKDLKGSDMPQTDKEILDFFS